ncbi:protein Jade-1-like [Carassius auratus]|uniref:Protein Jade-1-like n=1 Tax=Carassius auratus TaxID=7957 RepID=A0A6P6LZP5_CARAU|nr:protein Jade-1-like [Carassius auratus]XP_026089969.1 protein Jade-1-like [Carassius auratus]XP_026089970.1 protein Jade-1-like [Carassius auratus]XP_026089971.1 protein Jade-1-like [Carassius auratus]XP_026089973.1 protein Jade-1-like [Carassius auratus]XP_026089974.1 protein Jade-1-like [Carassius auratus]
MESEMKRRKYSTSSNDSDTTDSHVTTWSRSSKNTGTSSTWVRHEQKKPSEVFRTDFITAMKLPDSAQLSPEEFYFLSDPWRQEWEKGVQVPANVEPIPEPVVRMLPEVSRIPFFSPIQTRGQSEFGFGESHVLSEPLSCYDLDDLDVTWLELVNTEFRELALPELDELTMEQVVVELENRCQQNMQQAIETEEGLGIEYDEDVVCDVCRSPEGEDGNEMVFCDKCNVCVHQACYGILKVPQGNWLCRTCALGVQPKCLLCPRRGGALKPTRSGTKWVHVSCALWIPEVSIGCPEKMEPITKVSHIPASRWALSCGLCREHTGTCIQCSMPSCIVAFHVTCAFDHGLEMRTTLAENDEVRFKSYCLEHSGVSRSSSGGNVDRPSDLAVTLSDRSKQEQAEREKASHRKQKLQELEDEFYSLVDPKDVAESLSLPDVHVDFLFQYWKLRRKANFNQPLVARKRDEVDNLAQQEQDVLYRRLKLFTHLRQDLERVRNLCYMVTRREKIKHSLCNLQEKIFALQIQLIEKDLAGEKTRRGEKIHRNGVRERVKERRKSSPDKKDKWRSDDSSVFTQLGFSKSFPLDGSLFDSWLAQSVHITADNMLSQWSLSEESRDPSASLLSDQLLQGEENLLSLMMDHSIKSSWKTPQQGRKPRAGPRSRRKSVSLPRIGSAVKGKVCPEDQLPKRGERVRHVHPHHTRSSEGRPDPLQPAISKMDSCHISEEHGSWDAGADDGDTESDKRSQVALRLRLPRQGKSRSKSNTTQVLLHNSTGNNISAHDTETDGYFSDAEQSDSELPSFSRKLRLPQLHAGKEEVVRRSVLAS